MRIILAKNVNGSFGQKYLFVIPSAFSVVKLLDLNVDDEQVFLSLQDTYTGITKKVPIDVNDTTFHFLLISWDDIINMYHQTNLDEGID